MQRPEQVRCVPLCAASLVYIRPQWWQHEASCPVRIEYLERRAEAVAEIAEHDAALFGSQGGSDV